MDTTAPELEAAMQDIKSMSLEAVITRADGTVENLGIVSYYHQDPEQMDKAATLGIGKIQICE